MLPIPRNLDRREMTSIALCPLGLIRGRWELPPPAADPDICPCFWAKLAAVAARQGYQNTQGMLARHGRMAIRGELSKDYLDPGAAVAALMIETWANYTVGGD